MEIVQQATQNIHNSWQLIVAILSVLILTCGYFIKSEKDDKKYHRDRAEKKDDELKEVVKEFTNVVKTDLVEVKNNMSDIKKDINNLSNEIRREK